MPALLEAAAESGLPSGHTCPVAYAMEHGLAHGSPLDERWCISHQRRALLQAADARDEGLLLSAWGQLSIHYAPFDWVNTGAQVMLVGICPGFHQADEARREAARCIKLRCADEEALRRADAVGSFSGPMRTNLVGMADGIGLGEALGIGTTARLFGDCQLSAAHVSAIDYPIFVAGKENYPGYGPELTKDPVLRSLVVACLGARARMTAPELIIPLGKAASSAVELLAARGLVDRDRCLLGFPHPSPTNGHRWRQYEERKDDLARVVTLAFS